eukprot:TRINITY_DN47080_c0_g1_i1.p1 TRINITY_DN47080_c0_g1~~TRINITY_DN47080_c0_g1_i1.p1  ORF type:complete len:133 (+),score=14.35 TRINITY_DN47080_c0_g1_i1:48-446(+)
MVRNTHPTIAYGKYCVVHKHSQMGCAFVSWPSASIRDLVMLFSKSLLAADLLGDVGGHKLVVNRRIDKESDNTSSFDIFVAWGRKAEKKSPVCALKIAEKFDAVLARASELVDMYLAAPEPVELPSCSFFSN